MGSIRCRRGDSTTSWTPPARHRRTGGHRGGVDMDYRGMPSVPRCQPAADKSEGFLAGLHVVREFHHRETCPLPNVFATECTSPVHGSPGSRDESQRDRDDEVRGRATSLRRCGWCGSRAACGVVPLGGDLLDAGTLRAQPGHATYDAGGLAQLGRAHLTTWSPRRWPRSWPLSPRGGRVRVVVTGSKGDGLDGSWRCRSTRLTVEVAPEGRIR
jgi:hypothetical protein